MSGSFEVTDIITVIPDFYEQFLILPNLTLHKSSSL